MEIEEPNDLNCLGGCVGDVFLFDESPKLTPARVRPFVFAVLLLRGAVRTDEVLGAVNIHAHPEDIRSWEAEATQAELVVAATIFGLVQKGILRDRGDGLFVLDSTPQALRTAISITSALDAQLPDHLLQEAGARFYSPPQP